jgi:diguanylate cyclase (GGDEF)-like protein
MNNINEIMARLQQNDRIAKKFIEIETAILPTLNFKDLFEVLLTQIREKFHVPYVWITLIDTYDLHDFMENFDKSNILKGRVTFIDRNSFVKITQFDKACILSNQNLKPYFKLLPKRQKFFIKSLAIIPFFLDGRLIGSLNQADFSKNRFKAGMDTSSLDQLGLKISLCLSNIAAHQKLRFLTYHDHLTGLLSRRVLKTVLEREFIKATRYQTPLSVVLIDVDNFKKVNGTLGHLVGDEILVYIATQLKEKIRKCDILCRYGADDFIIILPNTSAMNAERILLRFQKWLAANPFRKNKGSLPLSVTIEVASSEEKSLATSKQLLLKVEKRLLQKKRRYERMRSTKRYQLTTSPNYLEK